MDKITKLQNSLVELKDTFDGIKQFGLDEEILIIYLNHKTGIGIKDIKDLLKNQDDFFRKLVSSEVAKEL